MKRLVVLLMTLVFFVPAVGWTQDAEKKLHKLDEVVVTATHKMKMINLPASVSLITAQELKDMGAKTIAEAVSRVPGVMDTTAGDPSVSIRGTRSTMAGGPVVLVDGIPQKTGIYRYDQLDFIPVSQVERIEVLKSTGIAYGPGAPRGVINIITQKGARDKTFSGNVTASYGSWNTLKQAANISGKVNAWDYYANVTNATTDGYEDENKSQLAGLLKAGYNLSGDTRLGLHVNAIHDEKEAARGFQKYKEQLETSRREKHFYHNGKLVWHDDKEKNTQSVGVDFTHKTGKVAITSDLTYTNFDNEFTWNWDKYYYATGSAKQQRERGDIEKETQDMYSFNLSGSYNLSFGDLAYTPSVGVRYEDIDFETRRTFPYDTTGATAAKKATYDIDLQEKQYGIFWDNDFLFREKIGLKIGARIDQAKIDYENKQPVKFEKKEDLTSWSVAPSYHFSERATVYLLMEKGYWLPTPYYYKSAMDKRGETVDPEETVTTEIGYKHQVNKAFNIALTAYMQTCKDKLATRYDGTTTSKGMDNIGETESQGVEVEIDGRINRFFGYRLAGQYMTIEWQTGNTKTYGPDNKQRNYNLAGYQVYGIPNYTYSAGLDFFATEALKCSMDVVTQGPYYLDYLNLWEHEAETTVNARISYEMKKMEFWLLGKNIFDNDIEHEFNGNGDRNAVGESNSNFYVQDGLYLEAGLAYHF